MASAGRLAATSSASGPTTTTTRSAPAPSRASRTQPIIGRPARGCSTLGRAERILVPWPAASTIAPRLIGIGPPPGWLASRSGGSLVGAGGFEPPIAGPKPAALPLGYAPSGARPGPREYSPALRRPQDHDIDHHGPLPVARLPVLHVDHLDGLRAALDPDAHALLERALRQATGQRP